ncbi:Cell division control protein 11 [Aspergillus melleus]|uniref:Cell division control protein 11 n=1 Tax=Aspergillus melleus TaxID=138277 RepID=UPI001E8E2D39|nr:Cell division control protein 11 [Aspergillus melleus]KAH8423459.1 Cell division control protein 11 [Aspergillus melleus]
MSSALNALRRKKNVKKGIQFCLMVCGASGTGMYWNLGVAPDGCRQTDQVPLFQTGRTTFVNTLCGKTVLEGKDADDAANAHIEEGVRIKPVTVGKLVPNIHGLHNSRFGQD